MNERCSAWLIETGMQCRARKDTQPTCIGTYRMAGGSGMLELPESVVIYLCPKHFVMKKVSPEPEVTA